MKDWSDEAWNRIDDLLDRALDVPPEERAAFLEEACPDDPALREQVETLIEAEEKAPAFLDSGAAVFLTAGGSDGDSASSETYAGRRVGAYRLLREIGRGGMSRVYLAERADGAFEQQVAVKLLPLGLDTTEARRRFRVERQVLAEFQHPHIARLLDGGVTDDDVPYLVMEHVEGQPLTDYCDARRLSIHERLELLIDVGDALQYAHRNLIVHRDLKPSNILVTDEGQVKLLDFGIAKLLDADMVSGTQPITRTGFRLMTPAYAAPEQIRGETVGVATDVYQLGVLTYELLTGHRPFESAADSRFEMERAVLEETPVRPSTAITRETERTVAGETERVSPESVSAARRVPVDGLRRRLRGDLDAVVMKALEKEPGRRYASAEAFVADVERHLEGRPVEARSITPAYRFRKFVRRHRVGVAVAAVFIALVAGFVLMLVWQQEQTARQRDRAQTEAEKAQQVSEFLVGLFEASDPYQAGGEDPVTARELLQRSELQIEHLGDQPGVRAQMLDAMGRAHLGLGHYEQADSLLRRALSIRRQLYDPPHPDIASSLDHVTHLMQRTGDYAAAESLARKAHHMQKALRGEAHPEVAESLHNLAFALKEQGNYVPAESLYNRALAIRREAHEGAHQDIAATMNNLGQLFTEQGEYAAAESLHRKTLAMRQELMGSAHPEVAQSFNNLAQVREWQGYLAEAESLYRKTLAIDREVLGPEHPGIATDLNNLAVVVERQGQLAEAESLKRRSLALRRETLGADHPDVTIAMNNLAVLLRKKGQYEEATSLFRRVLQRLREQYGAVHPYVAFTSGNLADTHLEQERYGAADSLYRATLAMMKDVFDERHPHVATALEDLAHLREWQERYAAAEELRRQAFSIRREKQGEHPETAESLRELADLLMKRDEAARAEAFYREALSMAQKALPDNSWRTARVRSDLGACLIEQGKYAAAEPFLQQSHATLQKQRGAANRYTQEIVRRLVELYEAWDKPQQATEYRSHLNEATASAS